MERKIALKVRFNTLKHQFDELKLAIDELPCCNEKTEKNLNSLEYTIDRLGEEIYSKDETDFETHSEFPDSKVKVQLPSLLFI